MDDVPDFDTFYAASRGRLLGQLTLMTTDQEQAQEALQEAYLRAWLRWNRVRTMDNPEAWVRTVAWRLAVSRWRKAMVALRAQPKLAASEASAAPPSELALDIRAALSQLPEGQRLVLVLHELCDLSVEQVSAETGIPVGTVKSRLKRGRAALAPLLASYSEEVPDVRPA